MTIALLLLLVMICIGLIGHGLIYSGGIYQLPMLIGSTFVGFALPQLIGLVDYQFLPPGALDKTIIMTILCAAMSGIGYAAGRRPMRMLTWEMDDERLIKVATLLSLLGAFFFYKISQLPEEMVKSTQWTGLPVAYLFLAQILTYGFVIAIIVFFTTYSRLALALVFFGAAFYLNAIIFAGRRGPMIQFSLIILLSLWFVRHWLLPRPVMILGIIVGGLLINSIGDYRGAMSEEAGPDFGAVSKVDFLGNFNQITEEGGHELITAIYDIEAADRDLNFDFGAIHWNMLIFNYVPAQIVGRDLKDSLMIPLTDPALKVFFYEAPTGITRTGMSDSFRSFWYFGSIKFFIVGFIMSKLYHSGLAGNRIAQILYMILIHQAMQTVTHHTHYLLMPLPHVLIFLFPFLLWCRKDSR